MRPLCWLCDFEDIDARGLHVARALRQVWLFSVRVSARSCSIMPEEESRARCVTPGISLQLPPARLSPQPDRFSHTVTPRDQTGALGGVSLTVSPGDKGFGGSSQEPTSHWSEKTAIRAIGR